MQNPVAFLRVANLIEAISYLVLAFVAMPLKWIWHMPLAVTIVGWIHGGLFAVFCWGLVQVVHRGSWPPRRFIGVLLAALVPVAPFFVDRSFPQWIAEWRPPPEE